jgi:hypothetical protein
MSIPNLHDRRVLEALVARMDTKAIDQSLDEGGLSRFAREVVTEELARRVLADEVDYRIGEGGRVWRVVDRTVGACVTLSYLVLLAWLFGLAR